MVLCDKHKIYFYTEDKSFVKKIREFGGVYTYKGKYGYLRHFSYDESIAKFILDYNPFYDLNNYYKFYAPLYSGQTKEYLKQRYGLYDKQAEGVIYILKHGFNMLLADDTGVGKTVQTIVSCVESKFKNVLVLTQNNAIYQFIEDIDKFTKGIAFGYSLKKTKEFTPSDGCNFYIINYESLVKYAPQINSITFDAIIIDEVHKIKNPDTTWTAFIMELSEKICYALGISATAIPNKPAELYNFLYIANHKLSENEFLYYTKYCGAVRGRFGLEFPKKLPDELYQKINYQIKDFYISRRLEDCTDLPENTVVEYPQEWTKDKEYSLLFHNYIATLPVEERDDVWKRRSLIVYHLESQYFADKMLPSTMELLETIGNKKTIIFTSYVKTLEKLETLLKAKNASYIKIGGHPISDEKKEDLRLKFQNDPDIKYWISTTDASHASITLNAAHYLIWNDLPLKPVQFKQGNGRHYRTGVQHPTFTYIQYFKDTRTELKYNLLKIKQHSSDTVLRVEEEIDDEILKLLFDGSTNSEFSL